MFPSTYSVIHQQFGAAAAQHSPEGGCHAERESVDGKQQHVQDLGNVRDSSILFFLI